MSNEKAMKLLAAAKAGRLSDVASLLDQGVPVNSKDSAGRTALDVASGESTRSILLARRNELDS
eukprot:gene22961-31268_t